MEWQQYRVVAQNGSSIVTSGATTFSRRTGCAINKQPGSQMKAVGEVATFSVIENDECENYSRTWERSTDGGQTWAPLQWANSTTLNRIVAYADSADLYRVEYTDGTETFYSKTATLVVSSESAPIETVRPYPLEAFLPFSESVSFYTEAMGQEAPTIQWQISYDYSETWEDVPGETGQAFEASGSDANGEPGYIGYRALFTNSSGSVWGEEIFVYWLSPVSIVAESGSLSVAAGDVAEFSVTSEGSQRRGYWEVSEDGGETWDDVDTSAPDIAVSVTYGAGDARTNTISITTTPAWNETLFRLGVRERGSGAIVYSGAMALTVT
jgi:hypothetical protein